MSGVILLIVPARGGPFHGGGCINATRWSAIFGENVVTVPANLPDTKGRSPVLMGGGGGGGGGPSGGWWWVREGRGEGGESLPPNARGPKSGERDSGSDS